MTNTQPAQDVMIPCANCKYVASMESMISQRPRVDIGPGAVEVGLLCKECGKFTHSYFMTVDLTQKQTRLNVLHGLFQRDRSQGHWITYDTARKAYQKDFEQVQHKLKRYLGTEKVR